MADLNFNDLQFGNSFSDAEKQQIQQALSANGGWTLSNQNKDQVNQYLSQIDKLRSLGATDNATTALNNLISSIGSVSRAGSRGMNINQAQGNATSGLTQELGNLTNLVNSQQSIYNTNQQVNQALGPNSGAGVNIPADILQKAANGDPTAQAQIDQSIQGANQLVQQQQQLTGFQNNLSQQYFGQPSSTNLDLGQAISSTGGQLGQLNQALGQQESDTFNTQLKPLIQMALGSQGLVDSGANVELQSKALAQLEQQRQANMMQAALGAQGTINNLQYSTLAGGLGQAQANLTNQFNLQNSGITMQFQQQLEAQREQLAYQLSQHNGGGGNILSGILQGGLGGAGMGAAMGGLPGALLGGALGGAAGGYGASQSPYSNPFQAGAAGGQLGGALGRSSFFSGSNNDSGQPVFQDSNGNVI